VRTALLPFVESQRLLLPRANNTVEVAHEALFRSWSRLRGWLEENAEAFHLPRDIRVEAGQWARAGGEEQQEPYLLRGGRLARARVVSQRGWSVMGGPSTASPSAARGICWPPPPRTTPRACVCGNADRDGLQRRSGPPVGAGIPAPRGLCGATAKLCAPSPLPPMAVASSPGLKMEPLASGRRGGGP
jgi:hypothetical protein